MFRTIALFLIGIGILIGVRYSDDIKQHINEKDIEVVTNQIVQFVVDKLDNLKE